MSVKKKTSPLNASLSARYLSTLEDLAKGAKTYAVVDYPDYANIGDSAIWVGQNTALRKAFARGPSYVCAQREYRQDLETFCPDGIIFINGGGNFGDIWPNHQEFRLQILQDHPHRRIVQLPQSIHFTDPANITHTKAVINAHPDFHLCVRDQKSYDFATREFNCPVFLVPDAAHCIPAYLTEQKTHEIISLVRTDKETLIPNLKDILENQGPVSDWEGMDIFFYDGELWLDRLYRRRLQYKLSESSLLMSYRARMYDRRAQQAVDVGTRQLSRGQTIVSDRLHAHILCTIMGKTHISIDNANGKIGEYIRKWGDFGITELVDTQAALLATLEGLKTSDPVFARM